MKVKLGWLNKQENLLMSDNMTVAINGVSIGSIDVEKDDYGQYYGIITLNKEVELNDEVYSYYINKANPHGKFWFGGIDFSDIIYQSIPAIQLKEMIIE